MEVSTHLPCISERLLTKYECCFPYIVIPILIVCAKPKMKSNTAENNCRNRPEEADDVQGERQLCLEDKQML